MSTDPDDLDEGGVPVDPEQDEPLVARLRAMRWPKADDETRERALRRFRQIVDLPPEADEPASD